MKGRIQLFCIVLLLFSCYGFAQFTPEEVEERSKWEEWLLASERVGAEQMRGSQAVTEPWVLTLEHEGQTRRALWKNPIGRLKGAYESWKWEIAAYRLDKLLGLNMVPPTIEKRFREEKGSCQLWVEDCITLKQKEQDKIKTPSYKVFHWNRALYLQRAFDNLIANNDRHQNQYLITKDWRMLLVDHSRSFGTSGKFTRKLIYTKDHKEGPREMKQLPKEFVEKLKALDYDQIKAAVEDYLDEKEIEAVLKRRDLILKEIDNIIKRLGEENVLY